MPFIASMLPPSGGAAAFVCRNFTCEAPVGAPEELEGLLA
jgi:hypothetical protein